eukprot:TRINITY_DN4000_c0_g1_i16.p1 TRINITY_DN4000_c0_g1~~TRINITY_DN4000_c0_g1_i16.p1  ORF type:complete len:157 (+),score=25.38 TRINITY_DN4000_c0_g1_i16:87-557(+)
MSRTLKVALPNKGGLFEPTCALLKDCGYKAVKSNRALVCHDLKNNIEFYFLRPNDIPMYVGEGIIDLGITGKDFVADRRSKAAHVIDLHYGHSRLCAAVPNESPIQKVLYILCSLSLSLCSLSLAPSRPGALCTEISPALVPTLVAISPRLSPDLD